ncbi:MAG: hypothetical protein REJ23_03025 [Brevundimonas sp.]|nr:hypothetical protein [Brevundimonas sp.]
MWRRLYVFTATGAAWTLLGQLVAMAPAEAAPGLAGRLIDLLALTLVLYLVAPTAQQLLTGLRLLKGPMKGDL